MEKIILKRQNPKIQVGTSDFDEMDVMQDTHKHRNDIYQLMNRFQMLANDQFSKHDQSKLDNLGLFTRALYTNFKKDQYRNVYWMDIHVTSERHHLDKKIPDDVTFIDLLEYMMDCICAGRTRGDGIFEGIRMDSDTLFKAFHNTLGLLNSSIEVVPFDKDKEEND